MDVAQAIACRDSINIVRDFHGFRKEIRTRRHRIGFCADWFEQPDAGHDMMMEAASIDTAQRINQWLISTLDLERSPAIQTAERRG